MEKSPGFIWFRGWHGPALLMVWLQQPGYHGPHISLVASASLDQVDITCNQNDSE